MERVSMKGDLMLHPTRSWSKSIRAIFRPTEVDALIGDASKARTKLGWQHSVSFDALVSEMVDADLELARREIASAVTP
jgi:nucleoside-diphosphate-sugar epimerase